MCSPHSWGKKGYAFSSLSSLLYKFRKCHHHDKTMTTHDYTWLHMTTPSSAEVLKYKFSISLVSVVITKTPWLHPVVRTTHDNTSNFNFLVLLYSLHMTTLQTVSCNFLVLLYSLTVWWVLSSPECRHHHDTIWHMTTPDWSIIYKFRECCHHDNTMTTLKYIIITNV